MTETHDRLCDRNGYVLTLSHTYTCTDNTYQFFLSIFDYDAGAGQVAMIDGAEPNFEETKATLEKAYDEIKQRDIKDIESAYALMKQLCDMPYISIEMDAE